MNRDEAKRAEFIKFIKSKDPFYAFASFEWHSMEQLEKIKNDIEQEIKATAEKDEEKPHSSDIYRKKEYIC